MRGFIGLCLLITGLSIGAYSHYPGPAHREATLAELTQIITGAIRSEPNLRGLVTEAKAASPGRLRATISNRFERGNWFANSELLASVLNDGARKPTPTKQIAANRNATKRLVLQQKPTRIHATTAAAKILRPEPAPTSSWRTAVFRVDGARNHSATRVTSLKPKTYDERRKLVKAIQAELKRAGCYWGKIDGVWGRGSKSAMSEFVRQVNAALPSRDPDYILLQLVSSHTTKICGPARDRDRAIIASKSQTTQQRHAAVQPHSKSSTYRPTYRIVSSTLPRAQTAQHQVYTGQVSGQVSGQVITGQRRAPLPGRMAVGVLNGADTPRLMVALMRISRRDRATITNDAYDPQRRRLKISALPTPAPEIASELVGDDVELRETDGRTSPLAARVNTPTLRQRRPFVTQQPNASQIRRAKAIRKAAAKKNRRRYTRRRYRRRRSVHTMFMHPLGRR